MQKKDIQIKSKKRVADHGEVFTNIREKRGYKVEVSISEETLQLIQEWFEMRKELDNLEVDAIFISYYNKQYNKMSRGSLQRRITKIGTIIGLDDFHSHCVRKTTLNNIYEKTGDLSLALKWVIIRVRKLQGLVI